VSAWLRNVVAAWQFARVLDLHVQSAKMHIPQLAFAPRQTLTVT
jgi:hypothetical protein